jgi:TPR repeat protein
MKPVWFAAALVTLVMTSECQAGYGAQAASPAESPTTSQDSLEIALSHYRRALGDGQYALAYHHLKRASEKEQPAAILGAAYLLAMGKGVEPDPVRADAELDRLPPLWLARAAYVRGLIALSHGDANIAARESVAWWECGAVMGDALATHRLATLRERAHAYTEANRLYAKSQADGLLVADINARRLARVEAEMISVADLHQVKRRALKGDKNALFDLARANHRGWHMPVNINSALLFYQRAARRGHQQAAQIAQLMLINRERNQRLDYAWIARLAWLEPQPRSADLRLSAARQSIAQELDPLWRVELIATAKPAPQLCELYARRGVGQAVQLAPH